MGGWAVDSVGLLCRRVDCCMDLWGVVGKQSNHKIKLGYPLRVKYHTCTCKLKSPPTKELETSLLCTETVLEKSTDDFN